MSKIDWQLISNEFLTNGMHGVEVMYKKLSYLVSLIFFLTLFAHASLPAKAEAFDLGRALLGGTVEYIIVKEQYKHMDSDKDWQEHYYKEYQKECGVSDDQEAKGLLHSLEPRLLKAVQDTEGIKHPFKIFINTGKDINAFRGVSNVVSINQGLFKALNYDEDEIAQILGHELAHGNHQHLVKSLDKILGITVIRQIYLADNDNALSQILSYVAERQVIAKSATLPNEWDADETGFKYAVQAGYNPGGLAAVHARIKSKCGDQARNWFGELLSPNDHPTFSQRIANGARKITELSGGVVVVSGTSTEPVIMLKGQNFMAVKKNDRQLADERAYLIAGNLTRYFMENNKSLIPAYAENGELRAGDRLFVIPMEDEPSAEELAELFNTIMGQ